MVNKQVYAFRTLLFLVEISNYSKSSIQVLILIKAVFINYNIVLTLFINYQL